MSTMSVKDLCGSSIVRCKGQEREAYGSYDAEDSGEGGQERGRYVCQIMKLSR